MSDAGEACLQSITSGLMYSRVPHIDIITWSSLSLNLGIVIMSVMMTVMWLAVCTEPLRKTEVDDPEVVVVVGVGEHDVERLEVEVEDPLAVDELDPPEKDRVKKKHGGKVDWTPMKKIGWRKTMIEKVKTRLTI